MKVRILLENNLRKISPIQYHDSREYPLSFPPEQHNRRSEQPIKTIAKENLLLRRRVELS